LIAYLRLLPVALLLSANPAPAGSPPASLPVHSASFTDGGTMAPRLTCDGADRSPQMQWPTPPAGTRSFAIVADDPDAPTAFTHWLAYGIAADARGLAEGASTPSHRLAHAREGTNSFGQAGYGGPCPPEGKPHRYVFRVYALDVDLQLPAGAGPDQVNAALRGHVLAQGQLTSLYARGGG
jgi:Raf kinase inhibitor-like YbhB/YbcL family protein